MDKNVSEDELTIKDDKNKIIKPKRIMKILGMKVNRENNLRSHLNYINANITASYNRIRDAVKYMTPKNKRLILNSKLRSLVKPYLPLVLNQNQATQKQTEVILMRINKLIYAKPYFMLKNDKICKEISMPNQERK